MPRITHLILAFALLAITASAHALDGPPPPSSTPPTAVPVGPSFGLGVASAASGQNVPRGPIGSVPEPETWIFTLAGLLAGALLRRRRR
jgi:hypothetical protein